MRTLELNELRQVSGGITIDVGYDPNDGASGDGTICDKRRKGNNGFGNGGDDGVPGNSGKTGGGKAEDILR